MDEKNKYDDLVVKKSNDLILSKGKSSLLEQKIIAIAVTRIHVNKNASITATIFPNELKEMLGREKDNGHIYRDLKKVSKEMMGHVIEMENGKGDFSVLSVITNADYKDGHFYLTFNSKMSEHIFNLKSHFTSYSLAQSLQLKNRFSFRFYELIKMDAYKVTKDCPCVIHTYGVSELKFMVGVLDINDPNVKECQDNGGTWDEMAESCTEKSMVRWDSFKSRVLDKAKKELDETADYTFDYNLNKSGTGGKVVSVELVIHENGNQGALAIEKARKKEKIVNDKNARYEQMDLKNIVPLPDPLLTYLGHNGLTEKDLRNIYNAADEDMEVIIDAIDMADSQKTVIENYVGWIISCVKNNYQEPQMVAHGSAERGNRVKHAVEIQNSFDNENVMAEMNAKYWNKVKQNNTEKFQEFVEFLNENHLDIPMFETLHDASECGDLLIRWVRKEHIDLM